MDTFDLTDITSLQFTLGVNFNDQTMLQQALIHRSYLNENLDTVSTSNERLEFLGDAILGFVVAERLYHQFPDFSEGELTKLRSALVRGETLSRVALSLNLGKHVYFGHGEEESGGRFRSRNLSCTLEAVIGAILIDQGFEVAQAFILKILASEFERVIENKLVADYKSRLQQVIQSKYKLTPIYHTVKETGPDHAKIFTVEALAGDMVLGQGRGRSKRAAAMEAARHALETLTEE